MRRRRLARPLVLPPGLPPGYVHPVPERGEVFYRHHTAGAPGAPPLLLLHGWTASADLQWFLAYEALGERYPFVAVDHRGHGRGIRSTEIFTLEDVADDAAAVIRDLGLGPVVAVGYSMGGPIAMLLAYRHPELVSGIVLEATALEWSATRLDRLQWRGLLFLEPLLRSRLAKWFGARVVRRLTRNDPSLEPYLPWVVAETRRSDPTDIVDAGRALATYDARPWAASLSVPAAMVVTTRDRLVRPRKQRALAAAVGATVFELDGDHLSTLQQGKEFADVTRQAVDSVVSRLTRQSTPG